MRPSVILKGCITVLLLSWGLLCSTASQANIAKSAQAGHLKLFINQIVNIDEFRNFKNVEELNRVSAWIKQQMRLFGIPCQFQTYVVNHLSYRNVICRLDAKAEKTLVLGAHYDAQGEQAGADNNASGVAGALEAARLLALQKTKLEHNVEFAFYTLEEPPYFKSEYMGSYIHAKSLKTQKQKIRGVIILDSIGYFNDNQVQTYPAGLKWIYPSEGNFIAAIGHLASAGIVTHYCESMQRLSRLECERFISPAFLQNIDFSGYLNYAKFNYSTLLITDTAHYRNPYYNTPLDTVDKLDLNKMADVVNSVVDLALKF